MSEFLPPEPAPSVSQFSSQSLFKSLVQALPTPILVVDRFLAVAYANTSAQRIVGVKTPFEGQSIGRVLRDEGIVALVQASIQTEGTKKSGFARGGPGISWNVVVAPLNEINADGSPSATPPAFFVITIEDVVEIQRLEQVQRDFIANISHELRTPLTAIRLLAETLEDIIDTDPDKAQEFVEKIEVEAYYLNDMVTELLDLSRIESGQAVMTLEPIEAERLVHEVMARMLPLAQRHRVTLRTDVQQGKTPVAADSKQITRVLVNLVHNAIKFTPSGGTITLGTTQLAEQKMQRFFVRDTGVGIRKEELPRVFERFYKTDRARSKADYFGPGGGGTGLGLAIARHVVEVHNGSINVESVLGQGSTFTFALPIVQK